MLSQNVIKYNFSSVISIGWGNIFYKLFVIGTSKKKKDKK